MLPGEALQFDVAYLQGKCDPGRFLSFTKDGLKAKASLDHFDLPNEAPELPGFSPFNSEIGSNCSTLVMRLRKSCSPKTLQNRFLISY